MREKFKIKNMYLDYNYYLNNKDNYYFLKHNIKKNNNVFITNMLKEKYIINDIKLDYNQKEAIYTNEENVLVLSGAGSGKTLTILGKIKYLIDNLHVNEKEILCISFTNETVNSLKQKINYDVDIFTFHKLALEIINDYNMNVKITSDYLNYIINEIFLCIVKDIDEKNLNYFNNTISSFINLFKNYNYDSNYFNKLLKKHYSKLLELTFKIYLVYQEELNSSNYIDFNDMINLSIKLINEKGLKRYYKYIIIDEFQDISDNRYKLVKTIKESCMSKIFAVGDDYQSIYRFTGSNINMITKFEKYFGFTKIIKINNTYRNSYELIKVASSFIMKNKNQMKKNLKSNKHINKPIKIIYYNKNMSIKFEKVLNTINNNVLILGRNNYDINYVLNDEMILNKNVLLYKEKEYKYMTIHKSKGLEEEEVIILNLNNNYFPSKNKNEITNLLLSKEKYLFEEERRLFYVALTRTKNNVYLFVDKDNPSIFVKEIIKRNKKYIEVLDL